MLRKIYKQQLKKITLKTLEKHKSRVIAVTGDGQTSIAREMLYQLLKEKYPVRRSLEAPEAEFSIPLTVLGWKHYPTKKWEWLKLLIQSHYNLKNIKPYPHLLILELNFVDKNLLKEWLEITKPETLLIVGGIPIDYTTFSFKKIVKIAANHIDDDVLGPFKIAIRQLGRFYEIDNEEMERVFDTFTLPSSKVRFFPGVNNSLVLDATHYQYPMNMKAVMELVDAKDNIILFSDIKADTKYVKNVNPTKYIPQEEDLIILRGKRDEVLTNYANLIEQDTPLT